MSDIRLGRDDDQNDTVTIPIRNRETDQFNEGDYKKTLTAVPGVACPVKAVARLITSRKWGGNTEEKVFGGWLRNRLCATLRIDGAAIGILASRIGNHSVRSGGATAMWRACDAIEIINRWGRWRSSPFQGYLRDGHRVMSSIGQ